MALRHLAAATVRNDSLPFALAHCRHLRTLCLYTGSLRRADLIRQNAATLTDLTFTVAGAGVVEAATACPSLRAIDASCDLSAEQTRELCRSCPLLERFRIHGEFSVREVLTAGLAQLKVLPFFGPLERAFLPLIAAHRNLRRLEITLDKCDFQREVFEALASLPHLSFLWVVLDKPRRLCAEHSRLAVSFPALQEAEFRFRGAEPTYPIGEVLPRFGAPVLWKLHLMEASVTAAELAERFPALTLLTLGCSELLASNAEGADITVWPQVTAVALSGTTAVRALWRAVTLPSLTKLTLELPPAADPVLIRELLQGLPRLRKLALQTDAYNDHSGEVNDPLDAFDSDDDEGNDDTPVAPLSHGLEELRLGGFDDDKVVLHPVLGQFALVVLPSLRRLRMVCAGDHVAIAALFPEARGTLEEVYLAKCPLLQAGRRTADSGGTGLRPLFPALRRVTVIECSRVGRAGLAALCPPGARIEVGQAGRRTPEDYARLVAFE